MPVRFSPNGVLNVAADPSDLPVDQTGKTAVAGGMTRCTNLHLDQMGIAKTRRGSSKVSATQLTTPIHALIEQGGIRYEFAGTWIYRNETSIASGLTSAKWSAIKYNAYNVATQSIFALNGTNRKRITGSNVYEWGIEAPAAAPVVSGQMSGFAFTHAWEGSSGHAAGNSVQIGTLRDTYQCLFDWEKDDTAVSDSETYRNMWYFERAASYGISSRIGVQFTYIRKSGNTIECESNPSDAEYVEAEGGLFVTWPESADTQVTHVRLYRTLPDGEAFYFSDEYLQSALSGACTKADASLGTEVESDHDRPPLGIQVIGPDFGGYCFIAKDNFLYFCKPNQPEYWPSTYYVEVSPPQDPIKGMRLVNGQVYIQTLSDIYLIQGTGYQSFFPLRQAAKTGGLGIDGILGLKGQGLFHVASDGLWGFSGVNDENLTNPNFRPVFQGMAAGSIPAAASANMANAWLLAFREKMYFGFPDAVSSYPSDVLVFDLGSKRPVHYEYGRSFSAVCVDETNQRILAGDSSGYVWELEDADATDDDGTPINWDWQSSEVTDQVRQYFPRSAKYDVDVGGTAAAQIILDGASVQGHALTGSRNTTKRLVATSTGKRLQSRIYGTGVVSIYAAELE